MILSVFGFGFHNISEAVADFYKFDKITNIERVRPENVTFPAITICTLEGFSREHYRNGSLIKADRVFTNLLKQLLDFNRTGFDLFKNKSFLSVNNHIDTLKIDHPVYDRILDCLRFNAVTNRSAELFKASSIEDRYRIFLNNFFIEDISNIEYYRYTFSPEYFFVYVDDNSLNSFENLQNLHFRTFNISSYYRFEIEKVSVESKLPEPYNLCKKSSVDEPFHQMNCIEACTYKEIRNKYNCTFHSTLFSIQGFRQCVPNYRVLKNEFSASCLRECPLESCFSEKFTYSATSSESSISTEFRFLFRDLSTLNITQIPKADTFTFLNNIGGGLGLFMGIAFPNLIEFFQFILEIILIIFIRKKK